MNNIQPTEQHWQVHVLLLKQIAREKKIWQSEIAEKTGLKQQSISRIFSLHSCPTHKNFLAIAKVVGVNFFFEDKESDTDLSILFNRAMDELGRITKTNLIQRP